MAFVKVSENSRGGVQYVNPESITGYEVLRETFGWVVRLHSGAYSYDLRNPDSYTEGKNEGWKTAEEAQLYLESWLVTVMQGVDMLKKQREEAEGNFFIFREPHLGDVYRILDNYWEVIGREPGKLTPIIRIKVLLDENDEYDDRKFYGVQILLKDASWFNDDNVEYVGNREDIEQTVEQLTGIWRTLKPYIQNFLDGFTGREKITVHYGDETSRQVYCCDRKFAFFKGHAFTSDPNRVTCPKYNPVVHYAKPEDNGPRCCGVKYPLPPNHTWTDKPNNVTCEEFTRNQASEPEVTSGNDS